MGKSMDLLKMAQDVDDVLDKLVIYHLLPEEFEEAEADWAHEGQFFPKDNTRGDDTDTREDARPAAAEPPDRSDVTGALRFDHRGHLRGAGVTASLALSEEGCAFNLSIQKEVSACHTQSSATSDRPVARCPVANSVRQASPIEEKVHRAGTAADFRLAMTSSMSLISRAPAFLALHQIIPRRRNSSYIVAFEAGHPASG